MLNFSDSASSKIYKKYKDKQKRASGTEPSCGGPVITNFTVPPTSLQLLISL